MRITNSSFVAGSDLRNIAIMVLFIFSFLCIVTPGAVGLAGEAEQNGLTEKDERRKEIDEMKLSRINKVRPVAFYEKPGGAAVTWQMIYGQSAPIMEDFICGCAEWSVLNPGRVGPVITMNGIAVGIDFRDRSAVSWIRKRMEEGKTERKHFTELESYIVSEVTPEVIDMIRELDAMHRNGPGRLIIRDNPSFNDVKILLNGLGGTDRSVHSIDLRRQTGLAREFLTDFEFAIKFGVTNGKVREYGIVGELFLGQTDLSADEYANIAVFYPIISTLDVSDTTIDDAGITNIARRTKTSIYHINNTNVTEFGLREIMKNKYTRVVYMAGLGVPAGTIEEMRSQRPEVHLIVE